MAHARQVRDPAGDADKWSLVPELLKARGLLKEHTQSFDHFVEHDIPRIVCEANRVLHDPVSGAWKLEYESVSVGAPARDETLDSATPNPSSRAAQNAIANGQFPANAIFTPHEARLRELTYAAPITARVCLTWHKSDNTQEVEVRDVQLGKVPIMLRSKLCVLSNKSDAELERLHECPMDPGGYFIVRGAEKVCLIQEQMARNRILVEKDPKGFPSAAVTSSTDERKSRTVVGFKGDQIMLRHNVFTQDIPLAVAFRAMGVVSDKEIVSLCGGTAEPEAERVLSASLSNEAARAVRTQNEALDWIAARMRSSGRRPGGGAGDDAGGGGGAAGPSPVDAHATSRLGVQQRATGMDVPPPRPGRGDVAADALANLVFAHVIVGDDFDFSEKTAYFGYVTRQVIAALTDARVYDDKDYHGNKRLELAGELLSLLFEDLFKRLNSEIRRQAESQRNSKTTSRFDPFAAIRSDTITNGLAHALGTGNWNLRRFKMERAGVTQQVTRLSYMSCIGHMTRITSQFEKTRKVSGPRSLQASQWGMICPCDTPEGESCGLVKNLALLAHVTVETDPEPARRVVMGLGVRPVQRVSPEAREADEKSFAVFLNGLLLGTHTEPLVLAQRVRDMRRCGALHEFLSVYVDDVRRRVMLSTEGGRVCRPLIIVDPVTGKSRLTKEHVRALQSREHQLTLRGLMCTGVLEYVDVNEQNNAIVASRYEMAGVEASSAASSANANANANANKKGLLYTHVEIDPASILGIVAGLVPFPHHNQSPRNTYQCAMGKQAVGTIAMNQWDRFDTLLFLMVYPHKPLVTSATLDLIDFDNVPAGQNAVVAVVSGNAYDIEDATIWNRASFDRGYGRSHVLRSQSCTIKSYPNRGDNITDRVDPIPENVGLHAINGVGDPCANPIPPRGDGTGSREWLEKVNTTNPPHGVVPADSKYASLDRTGVAAPGSVVYPHGILVHRKAPTEELNTNDPAAVAAASAAAAASGEDQATVAARMFKPMYRDAHLSFKGPHAVYVDRVVLCGSDYERTYKVQTRDTRRPQLGDKFSSRHGQKGVCGLILPHEDMPFSDRGVSPDCIMNPHGFPSRMTIGKILEFLASKAAVMDGKRRRATIFADHEKSADPAADFCSVLVKNGYAYNGKDTLYNGMTGEPMEVHVFMSCPLYQSLKHQVVDKIHARARGPRAVLTRQPTEGRSRDGGLRLGEMERDCLIAYGASGLLVERLLISSDQYVASVCSRCGLLCAAGGCHRCNATPAQLATVRLPYACKLLFQELEAMNIMPRVRLVDV